MKDTKKEIIIKIVCSFTVILSLMTYPVFYLDDADDDDADENGDASDDATWLLPARCWMPDADDHEYDDGDTAVDSRWVI